MPKTNYCFQAENSAADRFKGKIPYERVASFLYYNKGGWAQKVVVNIKYKGDVNLGCYMGEFMAKEMQQSSFFDEIDLIVPIPLHRKKLKKRGFNQAEAIAKGVGKLTGIVVCFDLVARKKQNQTQTKKGRYARWLNAIDIFVTEKKDDFNYNHILIVDDVLTTGATVEACAQSILQSYPDVKISVLTLAVTE
ncbi:MAG: ComF family protein [Candidatus Azobacteroides sp.]|nr:ComF family protein [Candidatus Azobacteroides sp.]